MNRHYGVRCFCGLQYIAGPRYNADRAVASHHAETRHIAVVWVVTNQSYWQYPTTHQVITL